MSFNDGEYFKWEDTGKELIRELVNFKIRVHNLLPNSLRDEIFKQLDLSVENAHLCSLNFDNLEEYHRLNQIYTDSIREIENDTPH